MDENVPTLRDITGADLWSMVPGIVAGIAAYVVCLSAARWLGFFAVIDGRLMALMSVQDLVSNSLTYLPFALFALMMAGLFHLSRGGLPYEAPKWTSFIYSAGEHPWRSLRNNLLFLVFMAAITDDWPFAVLLNGLWVYLNVIDLLQAHGLYLRNRFVPEFVSGLFYVAIAFMQGVSAAYVLPEKANYEIDRAGVAEQVVLLAATHDFILVRLASGQVSAVSSAEVRAITQLQPQPSKRKAVLPLFDWVGSGWHWFIGLFANPSPAPVSTPLPSASSP